MKYLALVVALSFLAPTAVAHSWLDCIKTIINYTELRNWRQWAFDANKPGATIRYNVNAIKWDCAGFPANKTFHGDWIKESSFYNWPINDYACHPDQRQFGYQAPGRHMAVVKAGDVTRLKFWGNGHSSYHIGSPRHRDPGLVRIYSTGRPGKSIVWAKDLTEKYWVPGAQTNFTADAIIFPEKKDVPTMDEKANYMNFRVPKRMKNGVYQFVWAWAWEQSINDDDFGRPVSSKVYNNAWTNTLSTCFFVKVVGSSYKGDACPDILANKPGFNSKALEDKIRTKACSKTCYRGGQKSSPCRGKNCPPCWYKTNGQVNCFEYLDGKCPFPHYTVCDGKSHPQSNKPAIFNSPIQPQMAPPNPKKIKKICPKKCYRGGIANQVCSGNKCPPCVYPNPHGQYVNCFEYKPGTTECPFPNGLLCKTMKKRDLLDTEPANLFEQSHLRHRSV
jgi:hypothetical protein